MSEQTSAPLDRILSSNSTLLTPNLEAQRLGATVVEYSVEGDPRHPPEGTPRYKESKAEMGELRAVQASMLNAFDIHAACSGPGRLALVRKMSPHGMNEMTVMAQDGYDGVAIDSLFGFAPEVRQSFYQVGNAFAEYANGKDLYPILSWTYDPYTNDRQAAQSVKIYHLQLVARSNQELTEMEQIARPVADLAGVVQRRQFIDESSIVYSLVLSDYFNAHPVGNLKPIPPFSIDNCSNLRFKVGKEWSDILTEEFDKNLAHMHKAMISLFSNFYGAATTGDQGEWQRPEFSPDRMLTYIDTLTWLNPGTKDVFKFFVSGLQNKYISQVDRLKRLGLISHVYPLAGLCYGTAINKAKNGDLMVSIRPQLFAETGGTGLQYYDPIDAHVKMKRGSGMYSDAELAKKEAFESDCASYIVAKVA